MLAIRLASPHDRPHVERFYVLNNYPVKMTDSATPFIAEEAGEVVGIVRLEPEEGHLVLRGMRVRPDKQRQGIGTALLLELEKHLDHETCWCICFTHLLKFYGQIGFKPISEEPGPSHLQTRLAEYRDLGHSARGTCMRPRCLGG